MPRSGLNAHSWRRTVLSKLAIDLAWDHSGCKPDWHLELIGPQRKRRDRTTILFRVEKLQSKNPFFQKAAGNGISILAYPCRLLEFGMLCAWSPYFHRNEIWFSTTANGETHNCVEGLRTGARKVVSASVVGY